MFEPRHQPLVPRRLFFKRVAKNFFMALCIIAVSLFVGMAGYHYTENLNWLDAYLNASMILAGMGPVDPLHTSLGKFFAGTYALFSGIVFLIVIAVIMAPIFHRFMHKFHLEEQEQDKQATKK